MDELIPLELVPPENVEPERLFELEAESLVSDPGSVGADPGLVVAATRPRAPTAASEPNATPAVRRLSLRTAASRN